MKANFSFKCLASRVYLSLLRLIYGFDNWHVSGNISCRTYKYQVLELVNFVKPNSAVEIGCGLGDLICNIDAPNKIGIDIDKNVIKAAKFLRGSKCSFITGSFDEAKELQADLLLMVNWIHELDTVTLENILNELSCKYRYLLVDTITSDRNEYKYKHKFSAINAIGELI